MARWEQAALLAALVGCAATGGSEPAVEVGAFLEGPPRRPRLRVWVTPEGGFGGRAAVVLRTRGSTAAVASDLEGGATRIELLPLALGAVRAGEAELSLTLEVRPRRAAEEALPPHRVYQPLPVPEDRLWGWVARAVRDDPAVLEGLPGAPDPVAFWGAAAEAAADDALRARAEEQRDAWRGVLEPEALARDQAAREEAQRRRRVFAGRFQGLTDGSDGFTADLEVDARGAVTGTLYDPAGRSLELKAAITESGRLRGTATDPLDGRVYPLEGVRDPEDERLLLDVGALGRVRLARAPE